MGAIEIPGGDFRASHIEDGISLAAPVVAPGPSTADLASHGPGIALAGADAAYVVDYGGTTVSRVDRHGRRMVIAGGVASPVGLAPAPATAA